MYELLDHEQIGNNYSQAVILKLTLALLIACSKTMMTYTKVYV